MTPRLPSGLVVALAALAAALPVQAASCAAKSTARTAALVELYTSEGCSSCPPADRWLSSLDVGARDAVVPLALHVDYWDYIGWKDPFAKHAFAARQKRIAAVQHSSFVYTPQVMLQGKDFRGWDSEEFDRAVARINAQPAKAAIALAIERVRSDSLRVEATAQLTDPARRGAAALYLAVYQNKLISRVRAGENQGRTLAHDFVVRDWVGPIEFGADGHVRDGRDLPLPPESAAKDSGVAAFVQDRSTAEVLQALLLPACPG